MFLFMAGGMPHSDILPHPTHNSIKNISTPQWKIFKASDAIVIIPGASGSPRVGLRATAPAQTADPSSIKFSVARLCNKIAGKI
jgi:hypothetical protein